MKFRSNLVFILIIILFAFLPFSSWLVSLNGNPWISLIRDILIFFIALLALFEIKKLNKISLLIALVFIIYGLLTFFWRHSSPEQWLRGFRFFFFPLIFYLSASLFSFSDKQKKVLLWVILGGFIVLGTIAILEYFNIRIPLAKDSYINGSLEDFQGLGNKARLQSLLAGPNAFGIYLVAITACCLSAFGKISNKLFYLIIISTALVFLTYSRSAMMGLAILLLFGLYYFIAKKTNHKFAVIASIIVLTIALFAVYKLYNSEKYQYYVTHGSSTSLRTEQIKRIWGDKEQIGLFGMSMGTAGPSSQNRLDGGPNHWSENIYLDTFEETGLVGLILLLSMMVTILFELSYTFQDKINRSAVYAIIAFAIMGLFINIYTGQIGVFLLLLLCSLGLKGKKNVQNFN